MSDGGSLARLKASFVDSSALLFLAVDADASIAYASPSAEALLGIAPDELRGTNVLDHLHPDDLARAAESLTWREASGQPPPGLTRFRARHADGSWLPVDAMASSVSDGEREFIGLYVQTAHGNAIVESILSALLAGASEDEVVEFVLDTIRWRDVGSAIAVCWPSGEAWRSVATGLPPELVGAGDPSSVDGAGPNGDGALPSPWARSRASGEAVFGARDDLAPEAAALAAERGLEQFWIEPVHWSDELPPALITVWTTGGQRTPSMHAYGVRVAQRFVELILRFSHQARQLEELARHDPLTGLVNRRVFFERLAHRRSRGAVLYLDLDRFKPVNDEHGHAVGDHLLQMVALRITGCVRAGDLVARLGGDEFAVLCEDAGATEATDAARRIQRALGEPFHIGELSVAIGVTIGIARSDEELSVEHVERADQALRDGKAAGRSAIRHASDAAEPTPPEARL